MSISHCHGKHLPVEQQCLSSRSIETTSTRSLTSASSRSMSSVSTGLTSSQTISAPCSCSNETKSTKLPPLRMAQEGITPEQLARQHLLTQQQKASAESTAKLERATKREERRRAELKFPGSLGEFLSAKAQPVDPTYESCGDDDDMFSVFQWSVSESASATPSGKYAPGPLRKRSSSRSKEEEATVHCRTSIPKQENLTKAVSTLEDDTNFGKQERSPRKKSSSRSRSSSLETKDKKKKKKKKSAKDEKEMKQIESCSEEKKVRPSRKEHLVLLSLTGHSRHSCSSVD